MKKLLFTFLLLLGISVSSQILINEGFEATTTPPGWTYTGFGRTTTAGYPCTGSAALRRSYSTSASDGNAIYASTNSNGNAIDVQFSYSAKATSSTNPAYDGFMLVDYSVDGGANWNLLGSFINFSSVEISCASFTGTIPAGSVPANADFQLRISGTNSGSTSWYLTLDDVSIVQTATCYQPTNIAAVSTGQNSGSVTWDPAIVVPGNNYQIYYSTSDIAPTSSTVLDATNSLSNQTSPATISGLLSSTEYFVWVRSVCSGTDISSWSLVASFYTDCAAFNIPYFEDFDSTSTGSTTNNNAPQCWQYYETPGLSGYGYVQSSANANSAPNTYFLYNGSNNTGDVMLISPQTNNLSDGTNRVRFFAKGSNAGYPLEVGTMTDPANPATFSMIGSQIILTNVQSEYIVDIPSGTNEYVVFRHGLGATATGKSIYIDDVHVEDIPTCFRPNDVTITGVAPNSLTVSWTHSNPVPAVGYDVYYSTSSTDPGTNPTPMVSVPNTATSATLPSLQPGTIYYIWVRANCGNGDTSLWTYSISYTTACDYFNVPFTELFDSTSPGNTTNNNAPACWRYLETANSTANGYVVGSNSFSGAQAYYLNNSSNTTGDAMLVSPLTNSLQNGLNRVRFFAKSSGVGYLLEVGTLSNPTDPSTFTIIGSPIVLTTTHTEYLVNIPSGTDQVVALRHGLGGSSRTLYIDNVTIEPLPTCIKPTDVQFSNLTQNSVTVSWTASVTPPANGYDVYYSTSSTDPGANPTPIINVPTGTSTPIGSLTPATQYYVWVRANCAANDQSAWTLATTFTTSCNAFTVPYTENFDSTPTGTATAPNAPACWSYVETYNSLGYGYVSTTNEYSTPNGYYLYNSSDITGDMVLASPYTTNLMNGSNRVRFYARAGSIGFTMEVGTMSDPADASTFTPIGSPIDLSTVHTEYTVYIPSGTDQIVAFRHGLGGTNRAVYIDDIIVETIPACVEPLTISAGASTDTSVEVVWAPSISPTVSGYEIYYDDLNIPPTITSTPSITNIPTTSTSYVIPGLNPTTPYYVWVRSVCGSGTSNWSQMIVLTTECVPPSLPTTTGDTTCLNGTADLSATPPTGSTIKWYDAATGGNHVGTGNTFTTPALTTTTDYFASSVTTGTATGGKTAITANPTSGGGTTHFGLVFDVYQPITLQSVTVYPTSNTGASGSLTIDVIDANNNVIQTGVFNVVGAPTSAPNAQVLNLNFNIPVGTNYKLRCSARSSDITGLMFDPTANAPGGLYSYPYNIGGYASILTSTLTSAPLNTPRNDLYYYFYNWQVIAECESDTVVATATVDPSCTALGVDEISTEDEFNVYPNPFTDFIRIANSRKVKSATFIDMAGRIVKVVNDPGNEINLSQLQSGMYILQLELKDGTSKSTKLIKK